MALILFALWKKGYLGGKDAEDKGKSIVEFTVKSTHVLVAKLLFASC